VFGYLKKELRNMVKVATGEEKEWKWNCVRLKYLPNYHPKARNVYLLKNLTSSTTLSLKRVFVNDELLPDGTYTVTVKLVSEGQTVRLMDALRFKNGDSEAVFVISHHGQLPVTHQMLQEVCVRLPPEES
jgi:hypothetical protein